MKLLQNENTRLNIYSMLTLETYEERLELQKFQLHKMFISTAI